ncbi:MAG TPA: hypothetical protein PLR52_08020 [Bacteroidales bacterium]|nr:hypothetical protein [Bacteroidales bacterium]
MKKLFLLIAVISISTGAWAQRGKVTAALSFIEQGELDKAKEALDAALEHKKTKNGLIPILHLDNSARQFLVLKTKTLRNFVTIRFLKPMRLTKKLLSLTLKEE